MVGEAEDGAQALSEAAAHHPDVVLMDLRMPRMDGVQATRILRRQREHTRGVVDWDDDAQLERAVCNSGAQVGIPKDIGTVELVATLQDACTAQDEARPVAGGPRTVGSMHPLRGSPPPTGRPSSSSRSPTGMPYAGRSGARSAARWSTAGSSWWLRYVLLTGAGRRALASHNQHDSRSVPPDPDQTEVGASTRSARADRGSRGAAGGLASGKGKWSLAALAIRYPRILRS